MTVEQILANNSFEEGISILISSKEQYDDCCCLLDKYGYIWGNGASLYGENALVIPECKSENDYALLLLTLRENKEVTQTTFFRHFDDWGFNMNYFRDSCDFAFVKGEDSDGQPFCSIYKPYPSLKREIEKYAEDYWGC